MSEIRAAAPRELNPYMIPRKLTPRGTETGKLLPRARKKKDTPPCHPLRRGAIPIRFGIEMKHVARFEKCNFRAARVRQEYFQDFENIYRSAGEK